MLRSSRGRTWGWLTAVTPAAAFFLLYACGRFDSEPGSADSGVDGANVADATEEPAVLDSGTVSDAIADTAPRADADADAGAAADGACVYVGPGGGSASGGTCMSEELYSCNGMQTSLKCTCPGTCSCGAKTVACMTNCLITSGMRTQCGFPIGGGSSASASGI